jgi:5-methyltetrahydropteroyltriglutamate--homocysteine methyltransferase
MAEEVEEEFAMPHTLLPTTVVGSYPQPDWLVDRDILTGRSVPRVHAHALWRPAPDVLEQAQDDATLLAIREMARAGIDILSDGEIRRESYSNRFALALEGIDAERPATIVSRNGKPTEVPRVVGPIRWRGPVEQRDVAFLRAATDQPIKITLPGPFTLSQQVVDEYYGDPEAVAMAYAEAVAAEAQALHAAGADVVQLDEPWLQARPEAAGRYGVKAINRALAGVGGTTAVHLCFGYAHTVKDKPSGYSFLPQLADSAADQISIEAAQPRLDLGVLRDLAGKTILLGVLDLGAPEVESAAQVAGRLRAALPFCDAARIIAAPDCGMKYLPRARAFGKLKALAEGAALVRRELAG